MNHPPRRIPSADRPSLQSKRLLDQLRERIRYLHYSLKTEEAYLFWSRAYIRFHGVRHPKDMGATEVEAFLTHLTNARRVSVSTHKQALSALLFLYREVIGVDLPWMSMCSRWPPAQRAARWMRCWQPELAGISRSARSADTPSAPSAHASGSRPRPRPPTAARR